MTYFERRGIKLSSFEDLIKLLYAQKDQVVRQKLQRVPSCIHYNDISEMKSNFCGRCGSRNHVKEISGDYILTTLTLRDIVHDKNGFKKTWSFRNSSRTGLVTDDRTGELSQVKHEIVNCLRLNNFMLYLGNYEYLLASSFSISTSNLTPSVPQLWLKDGERAKLCTRCYKSTSLDGEFYILMVRHSWLSQDLFAFLYRKGLEFVTSEEFDVEYFKCAQTLDIFSNRLAEKCSIKEYSHWNCFV